MKTGFLLHCSFISLLLHCTACGEKEQLLFDSSVTFCHDTIDHKHLTTGRMLDLSPPIRIYRFKTLDTLLIASGKSAENECGLHLYSLNSGKHLASFAQMGRGPDENLEIFNFQLWNESNEVFFYDSNARRARIYSINKVLADSDSQPESTVSFGKSVYDPIVCLSDSLYLCMNSIIKPSPDDRIMLSGVTLPNGIATSSQYFPNYYGIPTNIWYSQLYDIFYMNYSFSSENKLLVLSYFWTDLLEVYDVNLRRLIRVHGPERFFPAFGFLPPHTASGRQTDNSEALSNTPQSPMDNVIRPKGVARIGYELCAAAKSGFYASYNGAPRSGSARVFPENVYFFRYDGTPVYRYTFSTGGFGLFSVDEREEKIYLINSLGEMMIYNLNEY